MKPSSLKKDTRKSLRVSSEVLKALEAKKLTVQSAFDKFIDENIEIKMKLSSLAESAIEMAKAYRSKKRR